jgi:hypothetical protein
MAKYKSTLRIAPIALIIIIIAIAIAVIVSLARVMFFSDNQSAQVIDTSREALLSTTVERSVKMTVRGEIVADEQFKSYQITVSPSNRDFVAYQGYLDRPIETISLSNNIPAYEEFVYALDKAGLPRGKQLADDKNDTRGVCATGKVYEFHIMNGSDVVKHLWTSTCSGWKGSLVGEVKDLTSLFERQIPDSRDIIRQLKI